jgi:hypothetical protein
MGSRRRKMAAVMESAVIVVICNHHRWIGFIYNSKIPLNCQRSRFPAFFYKPPQKPCKGRSADCPSRLPVHQMETQERAIFWSDLNRYFSKITWYIRIFYGGVLISPKYSCTLSGPGKTEPGLGFFHLERGLKTGRHPRTILVLSMPYYNNTLSPMECSVYIGYLAHWHNQKI